MYYIQEPSAMTAAEALEVQPGETVLDLCAAPGGKTTQLAGKMLGKGLLVANEIHPQRARILSQNIERLGIPNALVLNEDSHTLAKRFPETFDKILCDAPCSGEGMFRRDEIARTEWSLENVEMCAERQREILQNVMMMLKPNGRLVYSTCTFSEEENEKNIEWLLGEYEELEVEKMVRIWPHKQNGEGHFVAVLHKKGESTETEIKLEKTSKLSDKLYREWEKQTLNITVEGKSLIFGNNLYVVPENLSALKGLKVLRTGLHLGTIDKKIFKPAHALALALSPSQVKQFVDYPADSKEILGYLHGETIPCERNLKGWVLVCVDGVSLGWGKASSGMIKNHYPKGLRVLWKD
jgi:NOL1/NOP2/fmu family ribosome biogenesis protein/23S rRNA U2552 (ribose-2'-O)-methylase RlmE/FtsJ